ncbi:MAG: formimidoylglutamase [Bdellovibrionales bacterium]|nr:formimidoylglutamase [Bdellovibrionales bacterium]
MENDGLGNFCKAKFTVLGFPDDLAVKNVNGRPGAAEGPGKFLEFLHRLKGRIPVLESIGNQRLVTMGADLEENHRVSAELTEKEYLKLDPRTDALIAVGGSHDYAYSWIRGIKKSLAGSTRIGCINLDAHFDLREYLPVMTSGSPFRRLIEEDLIQPRNLIEFGIQSHCNAKSLWEYAEQQKIETVPMEKLRFGRAVPEFKKALERLRRKCEVVVISLDLDSMSVALAPGVSAPQPEGFTATEIYSILEIAGADPKVTSLGIFELSPPLDLQDQTSRLAAQAAWKFMEQKLRGKKR